MLWSLRTPRAAVPSTPPLSLLGCEPRDPLSQETGQAEMFGRDSAEGFQEHPLKRWLCRGRCREGRGVSGLPRRGRAALLSLATGGTRPQKGRLRLPGETLTPGAGRWGLVGGAGFSVLSVPGSLGGHTDY